jgi:hypothetical protein
MKTTTTTTGGGGEQRRIDGFDRWAKGRLEVVVDAEDRRIALAYLRWHLRPRLAELVDRGSLDAVHIGHARQSMNAALSYLAELRAEGRLLGDLTQGELDRLFAERGTRLASLRNFLCFAVSSKRCPSLRIPCYRSKVREPMAEVERLEKIDELLENEEAALADRVAGLLVLCLAQPVARIARLSADAVGRSGDEVTVLLAQTPAPLPEPMGSLVAALATQRREHAEEGVACWLFPGRHAGETIVQPALSQRLRQVGITCTGRRAALYALARELPAPVLVDVLGYSRSFTAQLLSELRVDWNAYAALKSKERRAS